MNIDTGLAVVIVAVLIFYLRMIVVQRARARQPGQTNPTQGKKNKGKQPLPPAPRVSIISQNRRDQVIGISGAILIIIGVLSYAKILPLPVLQTYWWIPTALGIVAFSWLFKF